MTAARPLHVRVAEALGWTKLVETTWQDKPTGEWNGTPPGMSRTFYVSRFDTDWSATGPLIERYSLALWSSPLAKTLGDGHDLWRCNSEDAGLQLHGSEVGPTPLIAVCNLILALHAAGKLPK